MNKKVVRKSSLFFVEGKVPLMLGIMIRAT
jgi:hypothetical protein